MSTVTAPSERRDAARQTGSPRRRSRLWVSPARFVPRAVVAVVATLLLVIGGASAAHADADQLQLRGHGLVQQE